MNVWMTILVLMVCSTFCLSLIGYKPLALSLFDTLSFGQTGIESLQNQFLILLTTGLITSVILAGLYGYPNQWLIFAGLTAFLLSFATLPTSLLVDGMIPGPIRIFVGAIFTLMYVTSLLSWFKGGSES